jgi:hypothetical protein
MEKIVRYKIFKSSEEFVKFQEENKIMLHNIIPVYPDFENIKTENMESVTHTICILVTYTEI